MRRISPQDTASGPATVGILLFPGVEVLDFAGPYEVFSVASRVAPSACGLKHPPFEVVTIAPSSGSVVARHGLQVLPDHSFGDAPPIDILIIPGGVVTQILADAATLEWVRRAADQASLTASVCTGAFILASLGLLDGLSATTHWEDIDAMRTMFPDVTVIDGPSYVDEGAIVTSAGISAGIAMSLHLVRRLIGSELARLCARQMQLEWCLDEGETTVSDVSYAKRQTPCDT